MEVPGGPSGCACLAALLIPNGDLDWVIKNDWNGHVRMTALQ